MYWLYVYIALVPIVCYNYVLCMNNDILNLYGLTVQYKHCCLLHVSQENVIVYVCERLVVIHSRVAQVRGPGFDSW